MAKETSAKQVERALAEAERRSRAAIVELDQRAADLVSRGKYPAAEPLMQAAVSVRDFSSRVQELRKEWKRLQSKARARGNAKSKVPLWEYYQPILAALASLDGKATSSELEKSIEPMLPLKLKQYEGSAEGWKKMIRRARRPMTKEGFLELGTGKVWKLTAEGRRAASAKAESQLQ